MQIRYPKCAETFAHPFGYHNTLRCLRLWRVPEVWLAQMSRFDVTIYSSLEQLTHDSPTFHQEELYLPSKFVLSVVDGWKRSLVFRTWLCGILRFNTLTGQVISASKNYSPNLVYAWNSLLQWSLLWTWQKVMELHLMKMFQFCRVAQKRPIRLGAGCVDLESLHLKLVSKAIKCSYTKILI